MPNLTSSTSLPHQLLLWRGADRWVARWEVTSQSESERVYTVAVDAAGDWGCSCPGWIYNAKRTPCKHIRELRRRPRGGKPS